MSERKVLVLGAGMVARPCVEYLSRDDRNIITVACRTLATGQSVINSLPHCRAICLDVSDKNQLEREIANHDLTISLVPFTYHASVVEAAIKSKKNVVTTSYISPAMRALDNQVKDAGICVWNEVGVDPGVDHLYAIKTISEVHAQGGKILEFYSFCGGLPAPECANNALGFKFSWSPRGALLSQTNSASFYQDGERVDVASEKLMSSSKPYYVKEGYEFVAYANRDSTPFREFYGIPEAQTVVRGSLRYEGNPEFVDALNKLGWLDPTSQPWLKQGMTWLEVQQKLCKAEYPDEESIRKGFLNVCSFLSEAQRDRILVGFRDLHLLSSDYVVIRGDNLLDTLCYQLEKLLSFKPGERDLVMLQHKFVIEWENGTKETRTSTLELFGDPNGYSGMAKSVGVTCGIATQLVLDNHSLFAKTGIHAPYSKDVCEKLRVLVEKEGISMVENIVA